jgi:curved DNA-binding protein CbpA
MSTNAPTGTSDGRQPVARGRLEERPFPRLLHQLFSKRLTGCLQLVDDSRDESRVYLRDGAPVHVVRPNDIDRLDTVISEANLVPSHLVAEVSAALPPGRRLGEVLVERGLLSPAGLADALKLQMRRKLLRLFFPQRGQFAVFADPHNYGVGDEYKEMRVDPRCLMYAGVRAAYDEARLKAELAPLTNHRFRVLPTLAGALLEAMGFKPNEPMLVALGEKLHTLADLPAGGQRGQEARAIVLSLLYTDLLETTPIAPAAVSMAQTARALPAVTDAAIAGFKSGTYPAASAAGVGRTTGPFPAASAVGVGRTTGAFPAASAVIPGLQSGTYQAVSVVGATRPAVPAATPGQPLTRTGTYLAVGGATERMGSSASMPAVSAASGGAAASGTAPAAAAAAGANAPNLQKLEELVSRLGSLSHFELFGVPENASNDEVSAAYLRSMRQFHPDRLASLGLKEWTEKAARLVAQMNEAQAVLMDPRRRAEYVANRGAPPPAVDSGRTIIAAEETFQRGEVLLKKGDHAKALEAFSQAMKANPLEPAYKAYWAWTRFDSPGAPKDRLVRDTLKVLEEVLRDRSKFPVAHYWIGLLYKHLGDNTNAENAFRIAVGQDKGLLEAERELRLMEMRRTRAPVASASPERPSGTATAARKDSGGLLNKILKR